jgi:DNA mismatch repair protein MutL
MGKIVVLDEKTRLKIAAGEVVQNPASVVKELVENSIDAHSSKIVINIQKGGKRLIEVIDDGDGISPDDTKLLFQRYSTSKISKISDMENLHTLGFRGEALASIAAVSQIELITKQEEGEIGTRIIAKENQIEKVEPAERAKGTTVRVQNLFYNVPARLKFLKTSTTEFQSILEVITNYSLCYDSIHFLLTHEGEEILNSAAVSNKLDKIFYVYGKEVAKNMIPITFDSPILKISGFISNPTIKRGNRKFFSVFLNSRLIKSKLVSDAIDEAYKTILPRNQYPIIVLFLNIDPAMVDVNVHPTKQEVKLSQEQLIFETIHKAILDSFDREKLIPKLEIKGKPKTTVKPEEQILPTPMQSKAEVSTPIPPKPALIQQKLVAGPEVPPSGKEKPIPASESPTLSKLPPIEIIGQSHNLFIIAADATNLYIIDQHAAAERIMFEKFLKKLEAGPVQTQTLLSPITIEIPLQNAPLTDAKLPILKEFGFEIEPFGKTTYRVTKLPVILGSTITKEEIQLTIDELLQMIDPTSKKIPSQFELAQLYACKAAIKAGEKLTRTQMESLYRDLKQLENPFVCAHNRPTIITFSKEELERKFLRS